MELMRQHVHLILLQHYVKLDTFYHQEHVLHLFVLLEQLPVQLLELHQLVDQDISYLPELVLHVQQVQQHVLVLVHHLLVFLDSIFLLLIV